MPIKGVGTKKIEVPRKKEKKKSMLCNKLAFSMAPVNARRKGGQKLRPVTNPATEGSKTGHIVINLWRNPFISLVAQEVLVLKKP
jgi:hypothetical protein